MVAILFLLLAQVPCLPTDSTVVCHCKQGSASACAALRPVQPRLVEEIEKAAAKAAALEALESRKLEEGRNETTKKEEKEGAQESSNAPEPPDCEGQDHHPISKLIAKALDEHPKLRGLYKPRDPRYVTRARKKEDHCGYQDWHRKVDKEVIRWLKDNEEATVKQFEEFLRAIYNRPAMREKFPNGF
jgi:hypothetical protein